MQICNPHKLVRRYRQKDENNNNVEQNHKVIYMNK